MKKTVQMLIVKTDRINTFSNKDPSCSRYCETLELLRKTIYVSAPYILCFWFESHFDGKHGTRSCLHGPCKVEEESERVWNLTNSVFSVGRLSLWVTQTAAPQHNIGSASFSSECASAPQTYTMRRELQPEIKVSSEITGVKLNAYEWW